MTEAKRTMRLATTAGAPDTSSTVSLFLYQFDLCANSVLLFGTGIASLPAGAFTIQNSLTLARLLTTIPVTNSYNGQSISVAVDLAWTASAEGNFQHQLLHFSTPGAFIMDRSQITTDSDATVTGSVSTPSATVTHFVGTLRNEKVGSLFVLRTSSRRAPAGPKQPVQTSAVAQFGIRELRHAG